MTLDDLWQQILMGVAAAFGVLARYQRWTDPAGRVDWWKAGGELLGAPFIGIVASAFTLAMWPELDPRIMGGIAAFFGYLGPATIEAIGLKILNQKLGG